MDFHFLVMYKSWKINVAKRGAPWYCVGVVVLYRVTMVIIYRLRWLIN